MKETQSSLRAATLTLGRWFGSQGFDPAWSALVCANFLAHTMPKSSKSIENLKTVIEEQWSLE